MKYDEPGTCFQNEDLYDIRYDISYFQNYYSKHIIAISHYRINLARNSKTRISLKAPSICSLACNSQT